MPAADFNCLTCGACCLSPFQGEGYIPLDEEEESRLGRLGLPVLEIVPGSGQDRVVMLGTQPGFGGPRRCVALGGKVGGQVACRIYPDRPSLCRQFEAGSPECLAARQTAGIHG